MGLNGPSNKPICPPNIGTSMKNIFLQFFLIFSVWLTCVSYASGQQAVNTANNKRVEIDVRPYKDVVGHAYGDNESSVIFFGTDEEMEKQPLWTCIQFDKNLNKVKQFNFPFPNKKAIGFQQLANRNSKSNLLVFSYSMLKTWSLFPETHIMTLDLETQKVATWPVNEDKDIICQDLVCVDGKLFYTTYDKDKQQPAFAFLDISTGAKTLVDLGLKDWKGRFTATKYNRATKQLELSYLAIDREGKAVAKYIFLNKDLTIDKTINLLVPSDVNKIMADFQVVLVNGAYYAVGTYEWVGDVMHHSIYLTKKYMNSATGMFCSKINQTTLQTEIKNYYPFYLSASFRSQNSEDENREIDKHLEKVKKKNLEISKSSYATLSDLEVSGDKLSALTDFCTPVIKSGSGGKPEFAGYAYLFWTSMTFDLDCKVVSELAGKQNGTLVKSLSYPTQYFDMANKEYVLFRRDNKSSFLDRNNPSDPIKQLHWPEEPNLVETFASYGPYRQDDNMFLEIGVIRARRPSKDNKKENFLFLQKVDVLSHLKVVENQPAKR